MKQRQQGDRGEDELFHARLLAPINRSAQPFEIGRNMDVDRGDG
jgi:hypothetical protein